MTDRTLPTTAARADAPVDTRVDSPGDGSGDDRDDTVLVARVAAGDAEALGVLYDRHGAAAHAFARALVGGAADEADDVTAAVFAQLWRTAARYDASRGSVAAWVTMVTRARALDHVRARGRRTRAEERAAREDAADAAMPLGGSAEPPDAAVERSELARTMRGSLATLPEAQRRAIELAFYGGLSHADVAVALGQPLGTVKTRIRSGLLKMRQLLRPLAEGGA